MGVGNYGSQYNKLANFLVGIWSAPSSNEPVTDVFEHGRLEQDWFLANKRHLLSKPAQVHISDVDSVKCFAN
jgi:hypothetical protein